jgi:glycosidase
MPEVKFNTPDWAKHAVWYQVFPERFRNGDPSNDPGDKEYERLVRWTSDWWKVQPGEAPGDENFYKGEGNVWKRRYGGDLQGMKASLPYLRSLGINAIYFNPIFEADSMHKYDTSDYRHIDDNFGVKGDLPIDGETDDPATWKWSKSDLVFLDFLEEAHRQGFKVVLDGVFNHVGRSHPFFQDVLKNGKNSRYADWFMITDWGDPSNYGNPEMYGKPGGIQWRAWDKDNGHLPAFKKDPKLGLAPGPREHVFAITRRWLAPNGDPTKGIDGWRLDVPGDIPHPFWIDWRKLVKSTKPDAYISGEIWTWAQPWLNNGDQFDAVMNYRFATAAQDFFVNQSKAITPSQFSHRLNEMLFNYPLQVAMVQMNLFDSHDTDRLASMFVNPDLAYDSANRIQDNGPKYSPAKPSDTDRAKQRLAVAVQMTFVGAPMVYYGNENGMFSPDDPSNRQPMVWKDLEPYDNPDVKFDQALFDFHQRLIALRHKFASLRTGFFRPVRIDDGKGIFAYARDLHGESVYVVINRSAEPCSVSLPIGSDGAPVINWLDPSMATVVPMSDAPDSRPTIKPADGATILKNSLGSVTVELKPYSAAVLSELR